MYEDDPRYPNSKKRYTIFEWKDGNIIQSKTYFQLDRNKEKLEKITDFEYDTSVEAQTGNFYSLFMFDVFDLWDGFADSDLSTKFVHKGIPTKNLLKRKHIYSADGTLAVDSDQTYEYKIDTFKRITGFTETQKFGGSPNSSPIVRYYSFNYLCE